jgi:hypothetical protein
MDSFYREVFCANSIKDGTKEDAWFQLCQKTHFLQNKSCNPLSKSVSARVSFEEKEMRVFTIALALALTLTLFLYPERTKVATG